MTEITTAKKIDEDDWWKYIPEEHDESEYQDIPIANRFKINYDRELFEENNK